MKLDTLVSEAVVHELILALGERQARTVLGVSPARCAALRSGRGRLDEAQLDQVRALTGRTWTAWAADAGERLARTPADREFVAATRALLDPPDDVVAMPLSPPEPKANRGSARPRASRRRKPVA